MKFTFSVPSLVAHTLSIVFIGFSLPLVAQISVPGNFPECKIITPKTFNSINEFSKTASVPKSCFTYMIKQHQKTMLNLETMKYYDKAIAYEKSGEKQKAILNLTEYIRSNDSSIGSEPYIRRANLYRDLGDKENAIKDYKVADKILQQELNGVFGNGAMDPMNQENLTKVRTELSELGVLLLDTNLTTANILKSIAKIEVNRALNLPNFNPQHPTIQHFDVQLQELYQPLANTQAQPYKGTVESLITNAASEKMESLEKERLELIKKFSQQHPVVRFIDEQKKQLTLLINTRTKEFDILMQQNSKYPTTYFIC
jgi:tetratricopeptide (TPR) repeat protein